jgi:mono/diheme cytochrome c family protein
VLLALSANQKLGIALMAGAFVVFALVCAMLIPRYRPDFPGRHMGWFIAACVALTVGMLATIAFVAKETEHEAAAETTATETEPAETTETEPTETTETEPTGTTETEPGGAAGGSEAAGKVIFTENCGSCHTLADAGTSGTIGPNLDEAQPAEALVVDRVTNGQGVMPSFEGTLTEQQIADVAAYVSVVAGS